MRLLSGFFSSEPEQSASLHVAWLIYEQKHQSYENWHWVMFVLGKVLPKVSVIMSSALAKGRNAVCSTTRHAKLYVHPKKHPIPYIVHYIWPRPIELWSKVVHYKGDRVPFGLRAYGAPTKKRLTDCLSFIVLDEIFHPSLKSTDRFIDGWCCLPASFGWNHSYVNA